MNKKLIRSTKLFLQVLEKIPELCYVGDPILRQPVESVNLKEGAKIGDQLGEVLTRFRKITGSGRGLAAPQIGIGKAVFVTYVDDKLQTFINPIIIEKSTQTNFYKEVCLSSGIMSADVERPEWVVMEWTSVDGKHQREKFEGFVARLIQHEEAHLRGIVNLDEATPQGIGFATFDPLKEQLRSRR